MSGASTFQDAAENRLVEPELLLDRPGGQADLPANLPFTRGTTAVDEAELDPIGFVERDAIKPFGWEKYTTLACSPKAFDRGLLIERHYWIPQQ
jgi:hypothetical protein